MAEIGTTRMSRIYDAAHIETGVSVPDKGGLFRFLAAKLARLEDLDENRLFEGLWGRESMMSTLIAPGIALPHARLQNFKRTTGILAVIPRGCDYGEGTVKIALMIVDDETDSSGHLGILRQFALLARNPRFSQHLLEAATPGDIAVLIDRFERAL